MLREFIADVNLLYWRFCNGFSLPKTVNSWWKVDFYRSVSKLKQNFVKIFMGFDFTFEK